MTGQKKELDSRAKVIIAACEMFGEDPTSSLSVRSVAARAGVSMGSLRHHFPTQRALRDAVLETIYDVVASDDQIIHDRSVPPRDRLVTCVRQVLAPAAGRQARAAWITFFDAFLNPEPTEAILSSYLSIEREGLRRVEHWIGVLAKEGVVADGDIEVQARYLNTVLTGLSLDRALPAAESLLEKETATLYYAVDSILKTDAGR